MKRCHRPLFSYEKSPSICCGWTLGPTPRPHCGRQSHAKVCIVESFCRCTLLPCVYAIPAWYVYANSVAVPTPSTLVLTSSQPTRAHFHSLFWLSAPCTTGHEWRLSASVLVTYLHTAEGAGPTARGGSGHLFAHGRGGGPPLFPQHAVARIHARVIFTFPSKLYPFHSCF